MVNFSLRLSHWRCGFIPGDQGAGPSNIWPMKSDSLPFRPAASRPRLLVDVLLLTLALLVSSTVPTFAAPQRGRQDTRSVTTPPTGSIERLRGALVVIAQRFPGDVGVYVHHIESGMGTGVDEDTPYGMASTYKVPILVELMTRVDDGDLSLYDRVEVEAEDQHIGSGLLSTLWAPGIEMSLHNMATFMIILSDNSATDMLIDRLGADQITDRMRSLGFQNIRVDRTTLELILNYQGVEYAPVANATLQEINQHRRENRPDATDILAVREAFYDGDRDKASARDMTELLVMISEGTAVSRGSSEVIMEILSRTQTGANRLRGLLPPGYSIAHKTGTIGRIVNDVGVITMPGDLGRFAISVFTLGNEADTELGEHTIAEMARTAYDFFLFNAEVSVTGK